MSSGDSGCSLRMDVRREFIDLTLPLITSGSGASLNKPCVSRDESMDCMEPRALTGMRLCRSTERTEPCGSALRNDECRLVGCGDRWLCWRAAPPEVSDGCRGMAVTPIEFPLAVRRPTRLEKLAAVLGAPKSESSLSLRLSWDT